MKTFRKPLLLGLLTFLVIMLGQAWMLESVRKKTIQTAPSDKKISTIQATKPHVSLDTMTLQNTKIKVYINQAGGSIYKAELLDYANSLKDKKPFTLFEHTKGHLYGASTGFLGDESLKFTSDQSTVTLDEGENASILLKAKGKDGVRYEKKYTIQKDRYNIEITSTIHNQSKNTMTSTHYTRFLGLQDTDLNTKPQPKPKDFILDTNQPKAGFTSFNTYQGPCYYSDNQPYVKRPFTEFANKPLTETVEHPGWIAIQQRYFISAWVTPDGNRDIHTQWQSGGVAGQDNLFRQHFNFESKAPQVTLKPGAKQTQKAILYAGPEIASSLDELATGLGFTVDYGWLWFISDLIFQTLVFINSYLHSWGLSIVMTTLLIKILFYKLSETSYRTMALQKKLQPRVELLQKQYADDAEKRSQAMLELYRKENINPVGGCLPSLLQIPFFAALYYVLIESVYLRHSAFLWVPDLASHDPFFILPVLVGAAMVATNQMSPKSQDPAQAQVMMIMPVVFTGMFAFAPAGLVLYWFTNTVLSAIQQWYISRKYEKHGSH